MPGLFFAQSSKFGKTGSAKKNTQYIFNGSYLFYDGKSVKELEKALSEIEPQCYSTLVIYASGVKQLPKNIGKFTKLTRLRLEMEKVKKLPLEIEKLVNLRSISIKAALEEFPEPVTNLLLLTSLCLDSNSIATVPSTISNLKQLKTLLMRQNKLTTLPAGLGSLPELSYLCVSGNNIKTLPAGFEKMEVLDLSENNFDSLPPFVIQLKSLLSISIGGKSFNYARSLTMLAQSNSLKDIKISGVSLDTLPTELAQCKNIRKLTIENTSVANLGEELFTLTQLQYLEIIKNRQLTSLPAAIKNLKQLQGLSLDYNAINQLPTELEMLPALEYVSLYGSNIKQTEVEALKKKMKQVKFYF